MTRLALLMIDPATFHDWSALAAFAILFAACVGVISYLIGRGHGIEIGEETGYLQARGEYVTKIMRAKLEAMRLGTIKGLREAMLLMTRDPAPQDPAAPKRERFPRRRY
jgi:hypothetical protein